MKAVLFDLDGTLVDSLRDIAESMNAVLKECGFPEHPVDAYRTFVGDGMGSLVRRVLPAEKSFSVRYIQERVLEMRRAYSDRWRNHSLPYPGIREMLAGLSREEMKLGVFSNKPEDFTLQMVDHVFPEVSFHAVRGAREGVPVKPAPDGAFAVLEGWDLQPKQVMYVGDTNTDMATGKNTGMFTVGVTWGFRGRQELEESGADVVVGHPRELVELIHA